MELSYLRHQYDSFDLCVEHMTFPRGNVIGLIGENGAGKTTLMSCISGELKASDGMKLEGFNSGDILYIPSDLEAYGFLTVEEFLNLITTYNETAFIATDLLERLDLTDKSKALIGDLSQGMRKKISLAPIFVRNDKLLLLDEPFNSIDIHYIFELKKQVRMLSERACVLISSHILDTLADLCDEFYILNRGSVTKHIQDRRNIQELELEIFADDV